MLTPDNCPRCQLAISPERLIAIPRVCDHCGHTQSETPQKPDSARDKSEARLMIGIAGGILGLFVFLASSVEMRWLQTRDFVGLSSLASLERLVELCKESGQSACVDHALARQATIDPKRSLAHASYLMDRLKFKEAAQTLRKFATSGKADIKTLNVYACALAESGRLEEAAKIFERLLNNPRAPDLMSAENYVKYLTRAKRFEDSLAVILKIRRVRPNAMPLEYKMISEMRAAAANRFVAGKR